MKRSNRLVLLVGVFLAIVAFVGILLVLQGGGGGSATVKPPTTGDVLVAKQDIPLSTRIRADQVEVKNIALSAISPGAYRDPSQVVGQVARQPIALGAQITPAILGISGTGQIININCPATLRCIAVQVDQITGVGTVIKSGDYVDVIMGFTTDSFPAVTTNPVDNSVTIVAGVQGTSVKSTLLLQGIQVVGTLLPPPPAATTAPAPAASGAPAAPNTPATSLSGQQEIVILAVTPQQEEVVRFTQLVGTAPLGSVSLALRSADDFIDPVTGQPVDPTLTQVNTTGIILKTLVDSYGVLPPELIVTQLPGPTPKP